MENNEDLLNEILDEGISSYANGEPLAGLESRILARVQSTKPLSRCTNHPDEAAQAFASLREQMDQAVEIAPVAIPPLSTEEQP